MGDLQDPKMDIGSGDIPWNLGLKNRPKIYGTSNQSVPEMAIDNMLL